MKIILFANTFEYFALRINFLKELKNSGYKIFLIGSSDKFKRDFDNMGIETVHLTINRKSKNPITEFYLLIKLFKILNQIKPNIILSFTIKPVIYCGILNRFLRIPIISTMTGVGPYFFKHDLFNFFMRKLFKFSQKNTTKIVLQNKDDLNFFIKNNLITNAQSIVIPGFGIDANYFSVSTYPKNQNITFLLIARMLWNKGIGEYLEAARNIKKNKPHIDFQLLGTIDKENAYCISQEQIDSWVEEKLVKYLGHVDDVRPFISKANCIVLPSYREGMPRVLLQACSMGRPIITTNVPGCRDVVIHNENGFVCAPEDVNSLKTALNDFINLTFSEKEKMGLKARSVIETKFEEKIIFKSFLDEIHSLTK